MGDSVPPATMEPAEQRASERIDVAWPVDCETEETFLYASIANVSELGIFVRTESPLAIGTYLRLRFSPGSGAKEFTLPGRVRWLNEVRPFRDNINPGMGVEFLELSDEDRERIFEVIRTIAYLLTAVVN